MFWQWPWCFLPHVATSRQSSAVPRRSHPAAGLTPRHPALALAGLDSDDPAPSHETARVAGRAVRPLVWSSTFPRSVGRWLTRWSADYCRAMEREQLDSLVAWCPRPSHLLERPQADAGMECREALFRRQANSGVKSDRTRAMRWRCLEELLLLLPLRKAATSACASHVAVSRRPSCGWSRSWLGRSPR